MSSKSRLPVDGFSPEMFSTGRYTEDPFKSIRVAHKALNDQITRSLQGILNPRVSMPVWQDQLKAQMEALNKQMRAVDTMFKESLERLRLPDVEAQFERAHRARYDQIAEAFKKVQEGVAVPPSLLQLLETMDAASLSVDAAAAELMFAGGSNDEEQQQAAAAFGQLVQDADGEATIVALLTKILAAIQSQKDSRLQKWWWLFIYPLLLALLMSAINPLNDFYVKRRLEQTSSPQEATKVVKEEARKAVEDFHQLSDYRFVSLGSGKLLMVRAAPGARAPVVGYLSFGQAVHVVDKGTDFTLVEWRNEDGTAMLRGWVFSRYLKRFS
ncbi:SH3 domain-containing protein [Paucibacter sp. R3-3]|uniref:SH3 domain-containing protein n=1 Tax=Roseateles agri TaxID=3098619 RepID=A0ABU5DEW5_9BURK|nr:SH3 domain-containing protein [Paucibacter sp. R3-3]MDY0744806.1 SH3 domain-containing protein [Paucibacter sp. R3-3]